MHELKPYLQLNLSRVRDNARRFSSAVENAFGKGRTRTFFAVKSLPEDKVLRVVAASGLGFEVMTASQAAQARASGQPWIVSGFHKPIELLQASSEAEYLVVEGPHELERLIGLDLPFKLLLRIKLDARRKIGFSLQDLQTNIQRLKGNEKLKVHGLHFHLGWNVKEKKLIHEAVEKMLDAYTLCTHMETKIEVLNLGGSFCEDRADSAQLATRLNIYQQYLKALPVEFHFEPGRYIVGDAGTLFSEIVSIDETQNVIHLNTCAYGYKLNAATPRGRFVGADEGASQMWTVYGFWSAEGDVCDLELKGIGKKGSIFALENMGAYVWDMAYQFEPDQGVEMRFIEEQA
jgi:diaminopimelate decarboxylase